MLTNSNVFTIFQGEDKTMNLKVYKGNDCDGWNPLDLTDCTAISVSLPNADGTFSVLTLTSGVSISSPTVLGSFSVAISHTVSALLNPGSAQNFDVTFTISGLLTTVRYSQSLTVLELD